MNKIDRRYFYTVIKVLFLLLLKSEKRREDIYLNYLTPVCDGPALELASGQQCVPINSFPPPPTSLRSGRLTCHSCFRVEMLHILDMRDASSVHRRKIIFVPYFYGDDKFTKQTESLPALPLATVKIRALQMLECLFRYLGNI